jgi:hypothetical protein
MKDIDFFSFKSSVLCSFQLIMLLRTAIQIHFNRCLEVHTTINGSFGKRKLKMRNLFTDSRYFGVRYKSVIFCTFN